jgi:acyl carrier protein
MSNQIATDIIEHINTHCPQGDEALQIDGNTRLDELVLDSLELLELVFALESRYGVQTDEGLLGDAETISDLVALINKAKATEAA